MVRLTVRSGGEYRENKKGVGGKRRERGSLEENFQIGRGGKPRAYDYNVQGEKYLEINGSR